MTATTRSKGEREEDAALWRAWFAAAREPAVDAAVRDLYCRLDESVRARGPTCWTSGECCNFDAYGHRLYVTGLEIAWVLACIGSGLPAESSEPDALRSTRLPVFQDRRPGGAGDTALPPACEYQVDRLCSIHHVRPMGCRVFFCQEGTDAWQHELYERFLAELRTLHDQRRLPYRYMEWRAGLIEARLYDAHPGTWRHLSGV